MSKYLSLIITLFSVYGAVEQTSKNVSNSPSSIENEVILVEIKLNTSLKTFQDNINRELEASHRDDKNWKSLVLKNVAELEKDIEKKFEELKAKIPELETRINSKLEILEKRIPELEEKIKSKSDLFQGFIIETSCKEYMAESGVYKLNKIYPIEDNALHHVTLKKDNDVLLNFEMSVAIKAAHSAYILLSSVSTPTEERNDSVVIIGVGAFSNQKTILYESFLDQEHIKDVTTPNILSSARYTNFYIKISNGTLTFGKEGDNTPLLTYEDDRLRIMKYFAFSHLTESETKFYYDCPSLAQFL